MKRLRVARELLLGGAVLSLAACSAAPGVSVLPAAGPSREGAAALRLAARATTATTFGIAVPLPQRGRHARFVSPSTRSLHLRIVPARGGAPVVDRTMNLTAHAPGCVREPSNIVCSIVVKLLRQAYVATIDTYDALDGRGHVLSLAQNVPFRIAENTRGIGFTLSGVPHALAVGPASYAYSGDQQTGFTLNGGWTQPLGVSPVDADGNAIIGAGSPSYKARVKSGSGWTVTTSGDTIAITPPGVNTAPATIEITAAFSNPAVCKQPGAVCTVDVNVTNHIQRLFVANASTIGATPSNVLIYDPPFAAAPQQIVSGTAQPQVVMLDPSQNLWVGQCDSSCQHASPDRVEEYAPPYASPPAVTITNGVHEMLGLAHDAAGDIFVSYIYNGSIGIYAPPYTGAPTVIGGLVQPWKMVLDQSQNLYVGASVGSNVYGFAPPYTGMPTLIGNGVHNPADVMIDAAQNLYVADAGSASVTIYAPPYTGSPVATLPAGGPTKLAMDGAGDLFIACAVQNEVLVYPAPFDPSNVKILTTNVRFPLDIAVDVSGDVIVASSSGGTMPVFAPPYADQPIANITSGILSPQSLALTP